MLRMILWIVLLSTSYAFSQEKTFEKEVKKISDNIDRITKQHKDSLKIKVQKINDMLTEKRISKETAEKQKMDAANYYAAQIEIKVSEEEQKLQQLVQDKMDGKIVSEEREDVFKIHIFDRGFTLSAGNKEKHKKRYSRRTTSQFVFAFGVNNVLIDNDLGSISDSDYKFWQSHFYELGFTLKTRLSKRPSKAYLKYGFSFLWNNLRPSNNKYHVVNDNNITLETYAKPLNESRLRHVQLIFPTHLEWDFSKNKVVSDAKIIDRTHQGVRVGIGGFFGFKLGTRQYLEFKNEDFIEVEELQRGDFHMPTFLYGVSSYIAYKCMGLYAKYDLNPLFNNTNTNNFSLGIRFDIN